MVQQLSESVPLLSITAKATNGRTRKILEFTTYLFVALPTAVLNGLAAVSTDELQATSLQSPHDLQVLIEDASTNRIVYGVVALSASEAVLFFLNKRYLLASGKATIDLIKRTALTIYHIRDLDSLEKTMRANLSENILFFWSIATSLIFAEMGREALSFLGVFGEVTGFSLSLSVYFATRFAGAKMFLNQRNNVDARMKENYLSQLKLLDPKSLAVAVHAQESDNDVLIRFLQDMDSRWDLLSKDKRRMILLYYMASILSVLLVSLTALPIMSGFLPAAVQGAEKLTSSDIGASNDYQNPASFTFGLFVTGLTVFFYELNIKELPKRFLSTALSIYENIISGNIRDAMRLFGLTLLALGASYLTSVGFKLVADAALSKGYLSYLGGWFSNLVPDGLLMGTTCMLWSHLQDLINKVGQPEQAIEDGSIGQMTVLKAQQLLKRSDINISSMSNRHALFSHVVNDSSGGTVVKDVARERKGRHFCC